MKRLILILLAATISLFATAQSPFTKVKTIGASGRDGSMMFAIGTKVYFGGGGGMKDFWVYNEDSGTLHQLADIPGVTTNRDFGIGFAINGKGYIGMGYDGSISSPSLKNDLWQYDPSTNKWTQKANRPGSGYDAMSVFVIDNKAYIGGGSDNKYIYGYFYEYDAIADKWTQKNDLPTIYAAFPAFFSVNGKGYFTTGEGISEFASNYEYDTATDSWAKKADFAGGARQTCVAFTVNGKAYVGTGQSQYSSVFSDMYRYDPSADQWARIDSFAGGRRCWSSATSTPSKGYMAFGWNLNLANSIYYNDLWSFDPTKATVSGIENANPVLVSADMFPNPAKNEVNITFAANARVNLVTISDIQGKIVYTMQPSPEENKISIDVKSMHSGIYFVKIIAGNQTKTEKLVVQ